MKDPINRRKDVAARDKRLAEALRANLKRRKAAGKAARTTGSQQGKHTPDQA